MDIVDIAIIVTPIVIGAGFILAYRQWKIAQRQGLVAYRQWQASLSQLEATRGARIAQVILELAARWDSKELKESRLKVNENAERLKESIEQADANNSKELFDLVAVSNFFDTAGVLVMEGFLSCGIAYDLFGGPEEYYYNVYKPILEDTKGKKHYKYFIQLHEAFRKEEAGRSKVTPRHPV